MKALFALAAATVAAFATPASAATATASAIPITTSFASSLATVDRVVVVERDRRSVRRGYDNRRPRYRNRYRTVCRTRWQRGERVRVCRRVSWRR